MLLLPTLHAALLPQLFIRGESGGKRDNALQHRVSTAFWEHTLRGARASPTSAHAAGM